MIRFERYLLYIFLFSIPFQTRRVLFDFSSSFSEWTGIFLWATDILFAILLIFWIIDKRKAKIRINKSEIILLSLLLVVSLISIFNSLIPLISWYRFFKLFEYIIFFFYCSTRFREILSLDQILRVVVYSAFFQGLIAIGQYIFQSSLGLKILGESVLNPMMSGVATVVGGGESILRAYGTFTHPNVLALWLIIGTWSFWYLVSKKSVETQSKRIFWYLIYAVIVIGLILTFSRVLLILWLLSGLVLIRRKSAKLALFSFILILLMFFSLRSILIQRFHVSQSDESVVQRVFFTEQSLDYAKKHILIGNGIGQFVPMLMRDLHFYPKYIFQPVHNVYLIIFHETGLIGLFSFAIFLATLAWSKRRFFFSNVIIFTLLTLMFFDHYPWTLQQGGLMFWGILGILKPYNEQ